MRRILFVAMLAAGCNKEVEFAGPSADKVNPVVVSDQEFPAAVVSDERITYVPAFGLVEEEVTLKEKPPVMSSLRQAERPVAVDTFRQGSDGDLADEQFDISTAGKVDLIVVVDDSNSMGSEQASLAPNLGALTKHLKATDWQIGVVTTTVFPGQGANENQILPCKLLNVKAAGKPFKASDANAEKDFFDTVNAIGVAGSGEERGIRQAMRVIGDDCGDKWLRDDAAMAVLFVTDEENFCRNNNECNNWGANKMVELAKTKRTADKLKAYALLWNDEDPDAATAAKCAAAGSNTETYGTRYASVVQQLTGIEGSVCVDNDPNTNDYEKILEQISKDVSRIVKYDFELKHEPAPGAVISATVDGDPFTDFELVGRTLKLKNITGDKVKLKVSYRHDATAKFDRFALKTPGAANTIQAWVDGKAVDPSRMDYDEQTGEVLFLDMPPDDAEVKLKYRKEGVLPSVLDLARFLMDGGPLAVWVNGQASKDFEFDSATGVITFPEAPNDGAEIKVSHRQRGGRILKYKAGWNDAADGLREIEARDAETNELVLMTIDGDDLIFAEGDVVDGRKVVVTYNFGTDKDTLSHELKHDPIAGTLKVLTDEGKAGCITDVRVDERRVTYACDGEELGPVAISYKYVLARYTEFTLDGDLPAGAVVHVYVDGQGIRDFTVDGQVVRVPETYLALESKVRIIVTATD